MTMLPLAQAEEQLNHLAQHFAQWRQSRTTPRGRIPQPLWAQAVALTQVLSLSRVAKRLGLCPQRLRKPGGEKALAAGAPALAISPPFVELTPAWRSPTTEVEGQRADGTRLRILYSDATSALAPLLQTFLETR